jgi:vacuolar iron transporter family protein
VSSEKELYEREIEVEREEHRAFPEEELEELELILRAKGMAPERARAAAADLMRDPEQALDTHVREELGIDPHDLDSPWVAAGSSFAAFAAGAAVPVVPFLATSGRGAVVAAAVLSVIALMVVGALISVFTSRSALRSGLRMVAIGALASAVTFGIGSLIGVTLD